MEDNKKKAVPDGGQPETEGSCRAEEPGSEKPGAASRAQPGKGAGPETPEKNAGEKAAGPKPEKTAGPGKNGEKGGKETGGHGPDEFELLKKCLDEALRDGRNLSREKRQVEEELSRKSAALDKLNAHARQLVDEYDNFRRRSAGDKQNAYADAVCKAASALLPALDSLERAVPFAEKNPESFRKGVEMTLRQLSGGFKKLGVEEIEAKAGDPFDPKLHNAVMHVEDKALGESVVSEVLQKGYRIGDRVIRHSVVKVAN